MFAPCSWWLKNYLFPVSECMQLHEADHFLLYAGNTSEAHTGTCIYSAWSNKMLRKSAPDCLYCGNGVCLVLVCIVWAPSIDGVASSTYVHLTPHESLKKCSSLLFCIELMYSSIVNVCSKCLMFHVNTIEVYLFLTLIGAPIGASSHMWFGSIPTSSHVVLQLCTYQWLGHAKQFFASQALLPLEHVCMLILSFEPAH